MRRFLHLAPFLVLFGALLASFSSSSEEHAFFNNKTLTDIQESRNFLQDTDEEMDESSLNSMVFPPVGFPRPVISKHY